MGYSRREDYVERFRELFERAIMDQLRTERAGISISGGMDSTSIADFAYRLMRVTGSSVDFRTYTIIFKQLISGAEGDYAAQVTEKAGFPIEYFVAEDYMQQVPKAHPEFTYPEPWVIPDQTPEVEITRRVAGYGRVLLSGIGGDPALTLHWSHWSRLLRSYQLSRLAQDTLEYIRAFHRPPGFGLRTHVRNWLRKRREPPVYPD